MLNEAELYLLEVMDIISKRKEEREKAAANKSK